MPRNKNNFSGIFPKGKLSILIDASSLIRLRDFENSIKQYSQYYELYTTDFNKSELEYKTSNVSTDDEVERSSILFDRILEVAKLASPSNGFITVIKAINKINKRDFKAYEEMVMESNPENNLSHIDIVLMYISSQAADRVILLTSDTQLRKNAEMHGICSMGPTFLETLTYEYQRSGACFPTTTAEVKSAYPAIKEALDYYRQKTEDS